jgi:hypothetical protein
MPGLRDTPWSLLVTCAALIGLLSMPFAVGAQAPASGSGNAITVQAQFRGCVSAGWCRFWIEAPDPAGPSLYRVWPDGVRRIPGSDPVAAALRDRLNALLSNMIHQAKRIVLHDLRRLEDGTFAATVTVNGVDLASDPLIVELGRQSGASAR